MYPKVSWQYLSVNLFQYEIHKWNFHLVFCVKKITSIFESWLRMRETLWLRLCLDYEFVKGLTKKIKKRWTEKAKFVHWPTTYHFYFLDKSKVEIKPMSLYKLRNCSFLNSITLGLLLLRPSTRGPLDTNGSILSPCLNQETLYPLTSSILILHRSLPYGRIMFLRVKIIRIRSWYFWMIWFVTRKPEE